jgi:predicted DNA-binding protein (MmcQ/YjbR family)
MDIEWVRKLCLSFPHTTETVQWGNNLVFKVAGKMFAVADLDGAGRYWLSFKCEPALFAELLERQGASPAPYLARAHWVALERENSIPRAELKSLLRTAYDLVVAKLPRKARLTLGES